MALTLTRERVTREGSKVTVEAVVFDTADPSRPLGRLTAELNLSGGKAAALIDLKAKLQASFATWKANHTASTSLEADVDAALSTISQG